MATCLASGLNRDRARLITDTQPARAKDGVIETGSKPRPFAAVGD